MGAFFCFFFTKCIINIIIKNNNNNNNNKLLQDKAGIVNGQLVFTTAAGPYEAASCTRQYFQTRHAPPQNLLLPVRKIRGKTGLRVNHLTIFPLTGGMLLFTFNHISFKFFYALLRCDPFFRAHCRVSCPASQSASSSNFRNQWQHWLAINRPRYELIWGNTRGRHAAALAAKT